MHKIIHGKFKIYKEYTVGSTPCTQRVEAVFGLSNQRAAFGFNVRRKCFAHTTAIRLGSLLEENEAGKDVEVFTFLMVRVL